MYTRPSLPFSLMLLSWVNTIFPHSFTVMPFVLVGPLYSTSFVDVANEGFFPSCSSSISQFLQSSSSCSLTKRRLRRLASFLTNVLARNPLVILDDLLQVAQITWCCFLRSSTSVLVSYWSSCSVLLYYVRHCGKWPRNLLGGS